jgi:hypothetical protein
MLLARVCKLCGGEFKLEYERGRPRSYCFSCEPQGWKIVHLPHRVKLRRLTPLGPRIPQGGLATVYRIAP